MLQRVGGRPFDELDAVEPAVLPEVVVVATNRRARVELDRRLDVTSGVIRRGHRNDRWQTVLRCFDRLLASECRSETFILGNVFGSACGQQDEGTNKKERTHHTIIIPPKPKGPTPSEENADPSS